MIVLNAPRRVAAKPIRNQIGILAIIALLCVLCASEVNLL